MKIAKLGKTRVRASGHFMEIFLQISIDIEGQIKQGQDVIRGKAKDSKYNRTVGS
jgi:hypothetical protein